jgi:hypothetical protein
MYGEQKVTGRERKNSQQFSAATYEKEIGKRKRFSSRLCLIEISFYLL